MTKGRLVTLLSLLVLTACGSVSDDETPERIGEVTEAASIGAVCPVSAQGHTTTFDGLAYDVVAAGDFMLVDTDGLSVQVRTAPWAGGKFSPTRVAVRYGKTVYTYDARAGLKLLSAPSTNMRVQQSGTSTTFAFGLGPAMVTQQDGSALTINNVSTATLAALSLSISVPSTMSARGKGLCGNDNANKTDDVLGPDGSSYPLGPPKVSAYPDGTSLAKAWTTPSDHNLFVCGAACPAYAKLPMWSPAVTFPMMSCGGVAMSVIGSGSAFLWGSVMTSPNKQYRLIYQADGNLVVYKGTTAVWASNRTAAQPIAAQMLTNGDFRVVGSTGDYWNIDIPNTAEAAGAVFGLQDTGAVHIFSKACKQLW